VTSLESRSIRLSWSIVLTQCCAL